MEVLPKHHPRFCAQYVGFVGVVEVPRNQYWPILKVGEQSFGFEYSRGDYAVGDVVFMAKMIPTHRSKPRKWEIHQIILPECYFHYRSHAERTRKEQRTHPYKPYPVTLFDSKGRIVGLR